MTSEKKCPGCGRHNGPTASFCRHCGVALAPSGAPATPDASAELVSGGSTPPVSVRPEVDEQRIFRELCWLGVITIGLSVVYAISVNVGGESALGETIAAGATTVIAIGGALTNPTLVRDAFRLPRVFDLFITLLTALVTASALTAAFWLLTMLGFQLWAGYLEPYTKDGWPIWTGYVNIAIVTPIAEELLFRGVFLPKLSQLIKVKDALIVQAALFSAMHLSPVILVTHFIMGLALGFVRLRSGSLLPGILLHGAWNAWVMWSSG